MKEAYRKNGSVYKTEVRSKAIVVLGGAAVLTALLLIGWFAGILYMRNEFHNDCTRLSEIIVASNDKTEQRLYFLNEPKRSAAVSDEDLYLFSSFLMDGKLTTVMNRKPMEENDRTVVYELKDARISYTPLPSDSTEIGVRFRFGEKEKTWRVRRGGGYGNLEAWAKSFLKKKLE